ncbi:MAG: succinylglutamate desuccinylase/aspartoacylase family protein [Candidatus Pacebacteria bacterium]|nr:succinylglutamate desuccinylase/aspartoacylase family protein [Candidatus Paceibacterota bacterium]
MKVLVLGGMHGNEPLGLALVQLLQEEPIQNVETVYGNLEAITANARFTTVDLNRCFPGDASATEYEQRRAAELIALSRPFDVVLDFHNTHCPDNDCSFIGEESDPILQQVSYLLGLPRIIVASYDCLNKYAPNCLSVEVSLSSPENDAKSWYEKIQALAQMEPAQLPDAGTVTKYHFAYRMTLEDRDAYDLPSRDLKAFEPLPEDLVQAFGLSGPAYPIFINDAYTPYNYGGVLVRA